MTSATTDYIVEVGGVTHGYQTPAGIKVVLNNLNLRVQKGEFVTLVGPSGCGKSTLLRLILGQERPIAGSIRVAGEIKTEPSTNVGIVYKQYAVFPHLTALENIALGPVLRETHTIERWAGLVL